MQCLGKQLSNELAALYTNIYTLNEKIKREREQHRRTYAPFKGLDVQLKKELKSILKKLEKVKKNL